MISIKNFSLYAIATIATITNSYNYSSENNNVYKAYIKEQKQIDVDTRTTAKHCLKKINLKKQL